jgi:ribose/xylose/arabinose/galactoside ABC-type transport system permease subunit
MSRKRQRRIGKVLRLGISIGMLSGIILGLCLKWIEWLTGKQVYTLLLNVDFIPIIGPIQWPEWVEFVFHLLIAVAIGIVFVYIVGKLNNMSIRKIVLCSFLLTLPTIPLYFPLTLLALKPTPAVDDTVAIFYWTAGHLIFEAALVFGYIILKRRL